MRKTVYVMLCLAIAMSVLVSCKAKQSIVVTDKKAGYEEVAKSPIEKLALQSTREEFRAYGVGESPKEQLALNMALAQARAALQSTIQTNVKAALDQYMDQTEVNGGINLDVKTRDLTQNATKGILEGSIVKDTRKLYNSETNMYKYEVCVAYNKAAILGAIERQDQRILANREKFEKHMQDAWDELDRANGITPIREERAEKEKRVVHLEKEGAIKLILTLKNLDCNKETIQREFGRAYPELENCFEELYESVCTG